jgi:nucleotide-binding universal stress UspA family protein
MYKRMVVLLDGSEMAELVLKYAQELAGRLQIDLELLHVCDPKEAEQLPMRRAYIESMAEIVCAEAEKIRKKYGDKKAVAECVRARGHVAVGYPAEEILKFVDEHKIDLVMMSTHGSSGIRAWDLGGVANKVLHASKVPVWLVPSELREEIIADTLPKRSLVVPLDGSKQSEAALPHATAVLRQREAEAEMVLVYVHETDSGLTLTRAAVDQAQEHADKMKAYLERTADSLRKAGLSVSTELLVGEPAEAIIDHLKENPAQLLVMATRARTGISRMIFDSVTENVIHQVKKTPLLLVG